MVSPVNAFVNACLLDNAWSPDAFTLTASYHFIPLFLYGVEKVGYSEDLSKKGAARIGVGHTMGPPFLMYKHTTEHYPVVLSSPINPQNARVYGHLFMVTPEELFELDAKYQNGAYFTRIPKWVSYCKPEERGLTNKSLCRSRAWMYVGRPSAWETKIKERTLQLMPKVKPKGGQEFYLFGLDHEQPL